MKKAFFKFYDHSARWILRSQGFKSRFVATAGGPMHFLERKGQGDLGTIVFIHGMSADGNEMAAAFKGLKKNFKRIIAVDLPGHGKSPAPKEGMNSVGMHSVLTSALDSLLDEPAMVYGNSLGGMVSIRYANHNPDRVKGLVLSSPGGGQMDTSQLANFKARLKNQTPEEVANFVDLLFVKPPGPRAIIEPFVKYRFNRAPIRELFNNIHPDVLLRPEEISGLKPPTLILWGQKDALQHLQLDFFKQNLPKHGLLEEPEEWSHVPHVERTGEVIRRLVAFAREI